MNTISKPHVILDHNKPFSGDLFNREKEIVNLTHLLRNVNSPAVLALNSSWGTGKTTFVKMWAAYLKQQNMVGVYFNAWKTDHADDPLVPFIVEIKKALKEQDLQKAELWDRIVHNGAQLAKKIIPIFIKSVTDKTCGDALTKELRDAVVGYAFEAFSEHEEEQKAISEFRECLGEIVSQVLGQRVVVFVDELDRCRPTYAIKLLERIKHLFDVEGLIFVLSVDKTQLGHAIQGVYGSGCDAEGYLRRFIDLEYSLRIGNCADFIKSLYHDIASRMKELPVQVSQPFEDPNHCRALFEKLSTLYNLSLREMEQILSRVKLSLSATPSTEYPCLALLQFLMVVREKRRSLYDEYIRSQFSSSVLIRHIDELTSEPSSPKTREFSLVEGTLLGIDARHPNQEPEKLGLYRDDTDSDSSSYARKVVLVADRMLEAQIKIETLINRIEFADQFTFPASTPSTP